MTILLIYGHKGWIGQQILQHLNEINTSGSFTYVCGDARVDDIDELEKEIKHYYPTHIFSLIGRTHGGGIQTIDYLEDHLYENIRDNLFGPMNLVKLSTKYNYHFTYMGTGCIFEYEDLNDVLSTNVNTDDVTDTNNTDTNNTDTNNTDDVPYKKFGENDKPNFFGSSYSIVKGFTDQLIRNENVLNLRIRMPITSRANERNFITKITSYDKICSIPNSMSVLDELIPIMIDLIFKKHVGTINMVNPGIISHNEILKMYKEYVEPNFVWKNFNIAEQDEILKSKRSNNHLDTTLIEKLYPNLKNIHDSVKECLTNYNKNH